MSESPPEQGPPEKPGQPFGAPPGSAQWPQGGFGDPSGPPPTGVVPSTGQHDFDPQPYGGQYPQQPFPPQQGAYPQQVAYPQAWPQGAYAGYAPTAASFPASTAVLLAVSVVAAVATGIIGIPSAIMAALAWRQNGTDPAAASRRTTTGWIVFGINFAVGILLLIPFYIWASNNP